jgi:hypothetical protein
LAADFGRLKSILSYCEKTVDDKQSIDSLLKTADKLMKTPIPLKSEDNLEGEEGGALRKITQLTQKNVRSLLIPNNRPRNEEFTTAINISEDATQFQQYIKLTLKSMITVLSSNLVSEKLKIK